MKYGASQRVLDETERELVREAISEHEKKSYLIVVPDGGNQTAYCRRVCKRYNEINACSDNESVEVIRVRRQ